LIEVAWIAPLAKSAAADYILYFFSGKKCGLSRTEEGKAKSRLTNPAIERNEKV